MIAIAVRGVTQERIQTGRLPPKMGSMKRSVEPVLPTLTRHTTPERFEGKPMRPTKNITIHLSDKAGKVLARLTLPATTLLVDLPDTIRRPDKKRLETGPCWTCQSTEPGRPPQRVAKYILMREAS